VSARAPARGSGTALHRICALLLCLELGAWAWLHRSDAELRWQVARGSAGERIDALHVLANRGTPDPALFGDALVRSLLANPDDRLKELAFAHEIGKFGDSGLQAQHVYRYAGSDTAHWWRAYVLHSAKVGGGPRLDRQALRWWFDSVAEHPPDLQQARAHIVAARSLSERRRQVLGAESDD